jgi:hypothetical protein
MENEEMKELENLIKPDEEKTDEEISLEFAEEYEKLVRKYQRCWFIPPQAQPSIVKIIITKNPEVK